jgi:hypothetical protein
VDVIIGSKRNLLRVHSEKEVNEKFYVYDQPVASDPSYLAFSKVRNKLVIAKKFSAMLNQYKYSPAYRELLQYYRNKENSYIVMPEID